MKNCVQKKQLFAYFKNSAVLAAGLVFLCACAKATDTYLPDGSLGQSISCNGSLLNHGDCLAKAGEVCGARGYSLINKDGSSTPYSNAQGGFGANQYSAGGGFSSSSGSITTRSILVKCGHEQKKSKKKAAE